MIIIIGQITRHERVGFLKSNTKAETQMNFSVYNNVKSTDTRFPAMLRSSSEMTQYNFTFGQHVKSLGCTNTNIDVL